MNFVFQDGKKRNLLTPTSLAPDFLTFHYEKISQIYRIYRIIQCSPTFCKVSVMVQGGHWEDGSFENPFLFVCTSSHLFLSFRVFSRPARGFPNSFLPPLGMLQAGDLSFWLTPPCRGRNDAILLKVLEPFVELFSLSLN